MSERKQRINWLAIMRLIGTLPPAEFRDVLVHMGVVDPQGRLTRRYRKSSVQPRRPKVD